MVSVSHVKVARNPGSFEKRVVTLGVAQSADYYVNNVSWELQFGGMV